MTENENQDVNVIGGQMPKERPETKIVSKTPRITNDKTKILSRHKEQNDDAA
jgi:hypothetical protein